MRPSRPPEALIGLLMAVWATAACGSVAEQGEPIPSTTVPSEIASPTTTPAASTTTAAGIVDDEVPESPEIDPNPSSVTVNGPFVIVRGSIDQAAVDELDRVDLQIPGVDTLVFADVDGTTDLETTKAAAAIVKRSGWVSIVASDHHVSGDAVYVFLSGTIRVVEPEGRVVLSSWCCAPDGGSGIDIAANNPLHAERIGLIESTMGAELGSDFYWMAQWLGPDNEVPLTAALLEIFDLTYDAKQVTGPPRDVTADLLGFVGRPDVDRLNELVRLLAAELPTKLASSGSAVERLSGEILHISPDDPARTRIVIDGYDNPTVRGEILEIEINGSAESGWRIVDATSTPMCRNGTTDDGECR